MNENSKNELLSTSKLAFRFGLSRETVRKRIDEAGIEPVSEKNNEKLYDLNEALQEILSGNSKPLDVARLQKITKETERIELDLQQKKGEILTVNEVKEVIRNIFGSLQSETTIQIPKKIAGKLKKAKNVSEIQTILTTELNKPFELLRTDYSQFLK